MRITRIAPTLVLALLVLSFAIPVSAQSSPPFPYEENFESPHLDSWWELSDGIEWQNPSQGENGVMSIPRNSFMTLNHNFDEFTMVIHAKKTETGIASFHVCSTDDHSYSTDIYPEVIVLTNVQRQPGSDPVHTVVGEFPAPFGGNWIEDWHPYIFDVSVSRGTITFAVGDRHVYTVNHLDCDPGTVAVQHHPGSSGEFLVDQWIMDPPGVFSFDQQPSTAANQDPYQPAGDINQTIESTLVPDQNNQVYNPTPLPPQQHTPVPPAENNFSADVIFTDLHPSNPSGPGVIQFNLTNNGPSPISNQKVAWQCDGSSTNQFAGDYREFDTGWHLLTLNLDAGQTQRNVPIGVDIDITQRRYDVTCHLQADLETPAQAANNTYAEVMPPDVQTPGIQEITTPVADLALTDIALTPIAGTNDRLLHINITNNGPNQLFETSVNVRCDLTQITETNESTVTSTQYLYFAYTGGAGETSRFSTGLIFSDFDVYDYWFKCWILDTSPEYHDTDLANNDHEEGAH